MCYIYWKLNCSSESLSEAGELYVHFGALLNDLCNQYLPNYLVAIVWVK